MRFRHVGDGHLSHFRRCADHTRKVTGKASEPEVADVGRLEGSGCEQRQLPADVASRAMHEQDGVGAEVSLDGVHALHDLIVGLVPRDALPSVLAALAGPTQRVLQPVGMVYGLHHVEAAHAKLAVVEGRQRVALDAGKPALLVDVEQHAAPVMAARGRPMIGAGDGVLALLPPPFPLVVGLAVDRIEELLVIHSSSFSWRFIDLGFRQPANAQTSGGQSVGRKLTETGLLPTRNAHGCGTRGADGDAGGAGAPGGTGTPGAPGMPGMAGTLGSAAPHCGQCSRLSAHSPPHCGHLLDISTAAGLKHIRSSFN